MLPTLQIGPLAVQTPGLILVVSLWFGLTLSERYSMHHGVPPGPMYNMVLTGLIAGVIGARLSYIIQYPTFFIDNPLSLFSLNPGLLDPWGGIVIGMIAGLVYAQRARLRLWPTLDSLAPAVGVSLIGKALADFASGSVYGAVTAMPWSIELWGASRHPTQLYSAATGLFALALTWPDIHWTVYDIPGVRFLILLGLYLVSNVFIEGFRGDSAIVLGNFRAGQLVAWCILALVLFTLNKMLNQPTKQVINDESPG